MSYQPVQAFYSKGLTPKLMIISHPWPTLIITPWSQDGSLVRPLCPSLEVEQERGACVDAIARACTEAIAGACMVAVAGACAEAVAGVYAGAITSTGLVPGWRPLQEPARRLLPVAPHGMPWGQAVLRTYSKRGIHGSMVHAVQWHMAHP